MTPLRSLFKLAQLNKTTHNTNHNVQRSQQKAKLNRDIFRLGLVTAVLAVVLFAVMARGTGRTQASGFGERVYARLAHSTRYVAGKLGLSLAGAISGTVYRDYNGNGAQTASTEPGVSGVEVRAYNAAGTNVTPGGVVTTNSSGAYSIATNDAGSGPYRVEFTLPSALSYLQSGPNGANSNTSVQFVATAPASNINLGLLDPAKLAVETNPNTVTTCFTNGPSTGSTDPALVGVPYAANGHDFTGTTMQGDFQGMKWADIGEIGAAYGEAWQGWRNRLYVGAYHKRYSGYGPSGPDAIYVFDNAGGTIGTIELDTVLGAANSAGADPHDFTASGGIVYDIGASNASYDGVGKRAFGDMDISGDQRTLYVVNLFNRRIYGLDVSSGTPASTTLVDSWLAPDATGAGRQRPFGLAWHKNKLWVGSVDDNGSNAYVHSFDPNPTTNPSEIFTLELTVPLNFTRQAFKGNANAAAFPSTWRAWSSNPATLTYMDSNNEIAYPQAMLSDIEFDGENMVLGFRDRFGDQSGAAQRFRPTDSANKWSISAGDILRVCWTGSGYALEGSASCPASGGLVNSGPGGATSPEHYNWDVWSLNSTWDTAANNGGFHWETAQGGLLQLAGQSSVLTTAMDPFSDFSGGYVKFDNATGRREGINAESTAAIPTTGGYTIYESGDFSGSLPPNIGTFAKANGLGDIEAMTSAPKIELGNRVWMDADADGVQDPGEMALANVTVRLYRGTTLVGTARTDANGNYLFTSTPGTNDANTTDATGQVNDGSTGIRPLTAYVIRFDNAADYQAGGALFGKIVAPVGNAAFGSAGDVRDTDVAVGNIAGIANGNFPEIRVQYVDSAGATQNTTGPVGFNNHTYDAAFVSIVADLGITKGVVPGIYTQGSTTNVVYTVVVTNYGPADLAGATVTDSAPANVTFGAWTCAASLGSSCGAANGTGNISTTANLLVNGTATYTINATIGAAATGTITNTASEALPPGITQDPNINRVDTASALVTPCATITVNPATLPNGTVGTAYNQTVTASGGVGPYTFAVTAGTLPAGLTLSTAGVIAGTPTTGGSSTFTITATGANGCTGSRSFTVIACATITVNPATLPNGTVGTAYSQTLSASGGSGAYTFAVTTGLLPAGLTLSGATISGTPTSVTAATFTITATDANGCTGTRTFTVTPSCATITVNPATLPNGTAGTAYSQTLSASGGTGAYTFAVTAGSLPTGLTLVGATGAITGTPTSSATVSFTITATDANGCTGTRNFTVTPVCNTLTVTPNTLPAGTVGTAYNQTLNVSGNNGAVMWAVTSGTLPAGLSLVATTGVISGTPTAPTASPVSVTFTATDANGCTGAVTIAITINCAIVTINPASLPAMSVGTAYNQTLTATGTTGALTWSVSSGALPAGITLSSGGVLSGTPTSSATANFTVQVSDSNGCTGTRVYAVTPGCTTITVNPASLPNGTVGTAYNQTVSATGGTAPYSFVVMSGTLPAGLSLSGATISGTPTAAGVSTFVIEATDAAGCKGTRNFTVRVCDVIVVTPSSLPNATINQAYTQTLGATGGTGPYTFIVMSGTLPAGLTLSSGGALSGTPTALGTANFTISVSDGSGCPGARVLSITVVCATISITPSSLPAGTTGVAYSQQLAATGTNGTQTWTLASGTLPAGLTLSSGGLISGTPTTNGNSTFTVQVNDGNSCVGSLPLAISIGCATVTVNPATLPNGTVGTTYNQTISATGGTGSYTFSVTSGSLPAGLTLNGTTGALTGTPTSSATANFTITATDGNGCPGSRSFTVTPVCPTITVNPASLPNGTIGVAYSQTLTATGGTTPYTFSLVSGTLPAGLTLSGGVISGTPTAAGSANLTFSATDANGCGGTRNLMLTIGCPTIMVNPATLPNGTVGTAYSQTMTGAGGLAPYTFSVSAGALPAGLSLSGGTISGTPTSTTTANFTITTTDANGCTGARSFTVTPVCNLLTLNPATLPNPTVGVAYSQTLSVTGATGAVTYAVTAGSLPTGLTLSSGGVISGTTNSGAAATFTVTVTDANGCTGSLSFTLTPGCATVTITTLTLPNGTVGTAYNQTLAATGGTAPYTFAVTVGVLPAGLTLSGATISGTPTSTTPRLLTITVTDANGCTGTRDFTITPVCNTLSVSPASLPNGTVGVAYNQTLTLTGATGAVTWSVSAGTLPAGLTLSAAGVISGTPTSTASRTFTVLGTDANGCGASLQFTLTPACNALTINQTSLPNATLGASYNQTLTVTGATGAVMWGVSAGTLPAGLTLSTAGVISGTPTANGSVTFTVIVTDANGCTATVSLSIVVGCAVITVNPATLPNGTVGVIYNQTLTVTGATGAVTFSATGTLPAGLTLSTAGVLSGTPTSTIARTFTVTATDGNGCTGTRQFTITPVCNTLTLNPATLPTATVGTAYSVTFTATGSNGTVTYSVSAGTLPAGLTLTSAGVLSGTPTNTTAASFTILATDGNGCTGTRLLTLTPVCNVLTVNPATLPNGTAGTAYNQTLTVTGATGAVTWTVSAGTLPAGLTLSAAGVLSGTPTSTAARSFTIRVTDANGCAATRDFTITPACNVLTINPTTLPNTFVGLPYSQTLTVTGATGAVTWAVSAGTLPTGLTLTSAGVLSGTPTNVAASSFTIRVTDGNGCVATQAYTMTVAPVFSLGNRIFKDLDDNGTMGAGEAGINGVVVRLLTASGAVAKSLNGNDIAPITTAIGGYYRFDNLAAGDYLVEVAASNFVGAGMLVGCTSSTPDAGDPDADQDDSDDNGIGITPSPTNGFRSAVVTLGPAYGSEPANETDRGPGDMPEPNSNTNLTVDFGFTTTMSLGNLVWKDLNNNGARDNGEAGIDGVRLDLYLDRDNSGNFSPADTPAIANTTTANGGAYLFAGLSPGKYIVNVQNLNFRTGGVLLGCLSSTVTDNNPDNDEDNDDNGIDDADPSTNGSASRVMTLVGFGEPTTDGDGNNGNLTLDFGFFTPVNLGNLIWKDFNNNGVKDSSEPGVDGVLVELLRDADNSGALNGSELTTILQTRTTAGGGLYRFSTLSPGNYFVRVAASNFASGVLAGCVSSTPTDNTPNNDEDNDDNGIDNANPATNGILSGLVTLASGTEPPATVDGDDQNSNTTVDFGFFTPVNLGNLVWKDLNNDGFRQGSEPGMNGVKVELFRDANNNGQLDAGDGAMVTMTTTAGGGLYSFTNLSPGNYFVRVAASNFIVGGGLFECVSSTATQANANSNTDNDDNGIDNAAPPTNGIVSGVVSLQSGEEPTNDGDNNNGNLTVDFGFASANQSLGNLVWKDMNRNGQRETGEAGIAGVSLNLYRDNGDGVFNVASDVLVATTITDGTGGYRFGTLLTATYFVRLDAGNFAPGGALNGCISTNGTNNPNNDIDNDDNGSDSYNPATQPPISGPVTLSPNGEPTNDGDGANGNNTIDFGFVNFLTVRLEDPATCVGPGVTLELTASLTNPNNVAQPNNAGNEFEAILPAEVVLVSNSCVASTGACSFDGLRRVIWNGSLAANSTLTLRYRIQLANNVQAGVPYCITSTAFFDTDANGSNETSASVTVCDSANCPQVGPGIPGDNGCSVLIFPVYTSNAANPARANTRISITNTSVSSPATMHLFFVDGESCSIADSYLCLTPNQTTSFTMADLDPGTTGYLIAVSVDPTTGCPAYFNHLIGDEYVKFETGHRANLTAQCGAAQPGGDFSCNGNEQTATLNFDGSQYNRLPRVLSLDSIPSPADGNDTRLYLTRVGGNLMTGADSIGALVGLVYDDAEKAYSFAANVATCQLRASINSSFPRTAPRVETLIPTGRTGWMKLWTQTESALVGAAITFNPSTGSQVGAFNGGHDLHPLRYANAASITIPLFPGVCR